uniref:Uncharacterized protein n=1 Tax=Equus asinus TaxID=9793 RepID=A0A9L0JXK0_EQUAS
MVRTDTNAKKVSHQEAEVTQDVGLIKGVITVEAGNGRSLDPGTESRRSQDLAAERRNHDPEAGKENCRPDLAPAQDRGTGIGVEAGVVREVEIETERREWKTMKI